MEIKQLETFVCVAMNLNFSKAAEELHISQPSVSAQISSLERHLGAQLLARSTKEVSLTKSGLDFLVHAQRILSLRDQAVHSAGGGDKQASGAIDVISSTIPAQHLLPEIIASFQKQWPNIVFRLEQADSRRVEEEMSGFRFDFGMMGSVPGPGRFIGCPVYDDELVMAVPKDEPQESGRIRENFADFVRSKPFIMREAGSGTRSEIEALLSRIGVDKDDLRVPAYFADTHSILLAVSKGMGVSLVSKVAAGMHVAAGLVKAVEMDDPLFMRQIHLIHRKELWLSPAQQAFLDCARQFYR